MKKIALFGGSGKTGQLFLEQALAKGYPVKALVRTPAKLGLRHPLLEVVQGDVLNPSDVEKTVQGTDLVVSMFGHVKGSPKDVQTRGTRHIVEAMKKHGLRKIISLSGGGLPYQEDKPKLPDHLIRLLMRVAVPDLLQDAKQHAEVLRQSGLDWTIVRGPRLTDGEKKGQYRVGWVGVNASTQVSRADLADFVLQQVEEDRFVHQMPFVSY